MKLKVILIRAKDGKRVEKIDEFTTLERVKKSFDLFYPAQIKAYAIYNGDELLFSRGKID